MTDRLRMKYTRHVGASRRNTSYDVTGSDTLPLVHDKNKTSNAATVEEEENEVSTLRLMMISCEDNPPYGPSDNTARMFLDLLEMAYLAKVQSGSCTKPLQEIIITVYEAKQQDYPSTDQEWQNYDGILLPGSFSSAYENEEWIEKLKEVIQGEIHGRGRKTMAVCFGHQVFAHSFSGDKDRSCSGGFAVPCPASIQVGHFQFQINTSNLKWLSQRNEKAQHDLPINILYTHGDMVQSLPACATSLGGTETVPIQAAVYFFQKDSEEKVPYAYTFQGHPEYATNSGVQTFHNVLEALHEKGKISDTSLTDAKQICLERFGIIEQDSIHVMKEIAETFEWF